MDQNSQVLPLSSSGQTIAVLLGIFMNYRKLNTLRMHICRKLDALRDELSVDLAASDARFAAADDLNSRA
jgi:hypothetical protein